MFRVTVVQCYQLKLIKALLCAIANFNWKYIGTVRLSFQQIVIAMFMLHHALINTRYEKSMGLVY